MATVFSVISWIVFGALVGLIARFLVPGRQSMTMLMTIVLGIVGSFVGGGISWLIFKTPTAPAGWIMSIVGAIVVVLVYARLQTAKSA